MERKALIGSGVAVIAIVVIVAAVALLYEPGPNTDYDYTVNDVYVVEYDSGTVEVRADIDFSPSLDEGVTITATYHGTILREYTTTRDGVSNLALILNISPTTNLDSVKAGLLLTFSA